MSVKSLVEGFEVKETAVSARVKAAKVLGFVNNPSLVISKDYPFTVLIEMSDGRIAGFRVPPTNETPELFPELFYIRDNDAPLVIGKDTVYNLGYTYAKTEKNKTRNHNAFVAAGKVPVKMVKGTVFEETTSTPPWQGADGVQDL